MFRVNASIIMVYRFILLCDPQIYDPDLEGVTPMMERIDIQIAVRVQLTESDPHLFEDSLTEEEGADEART